MWSNDARSSRDGECPKSDIACHACRKRKVKCSRELPQCSVCNQTSQACGYPAKILKPGPKIGSTHQNRKRRRREGTNNEESTTGPTSKATQEPHIADSSDYASSLSREDDNVVVQECAVTTRSVQVSESQELEEHSRSRRDAINIHDLSFILHPAHEVPTSEKNTSPSSTTDGLEHGSSRMMARAAHALDVTPDALEIMIQIYFDNMTAINIFHEPSFREKLLGIGSPAQTHALLASILAFSARFCALESQDGQERHLTCLPEMKHHPTYFLDLASKFVAESLVECGDDAPHLCVLQAQILLTHGQLTHGVLGKAWRALGTCVRLAYELNLHLVDAKHLRQVVDPKEWCEDEEKRRAWWAVWEMDVFASTVRRYPTAVDWSQIETLLPIEDEHWFQSRPSRSCFLEEDPVQRWKVLQESGNHSAKAWYIVINSLMKEAQSISSPRSIPNLDLPIERRFSTKSNKDKRCVNAVAEAREKLEILVNCVHCFTMALPTSLKYRNQYLGFDARKGTETSALRQQHCGLYNIHVMTQLAKLMIFHYDIFAESAAAGRAAQERLPDRSTYRPTINNMRHGENLAMQEYFEAADEIIRIVHRSSDDHIQYINAFLASTIWLASAVQLVRKKFGPFGTNQSLVKSKFEVLNLTYKKCVSFWGIQTAMQQNLETLEAQLEMFRVPAASKRNQSQSKADHREKHRKESWANGSFPHSENDSTMEEIHVEKQSINGNPHQSESYSNSTHRHSSDFGNHTMQNYFSVNNLLSDQSPQTHQTQNDQSRQELQQQHPQSQQLQAQIRGTYVEPLSPALSTLDFMNLQSQLDKMPQPSSDGDMSIPSPSFMQDQGMFSEAGAGQQIFNDDTMQGLPYGMYGSGWNTELPSYIHELLIGGRKY